MGKQIGILQSKRDEQELNSELRTKFNLLCLPRVTKTQNPEACELGNLEGNFEQVIFAEQSLDLVLQHVSPVVGKPQDFHVFPKNGICIEWTRTTPGSAYFPGRYYLACDDPVDQMSCSFLEQVYDFVARFIRRHYPKRTALRGGYYIGPDLAQLLERGDASLAYNYPILDSTSVR